MGEGSRIEWTHHTFNPWWGCVKVSAACLNCYAESLDRRVSGKANAHWGAASPRRFFGQAHWDEPLKWDKKAEAAGERHRVFCASMADVFELRDDLNAERLRLWRLIEATPHLDWLLLTKRPENIASLLPWRATRANLWLGTTAENQEQFDLRVPLLLEAPAAAVRFLSCEPLLGPIDITEADDFHLRVGPIDWVIVGGESGHGARPMDPKWVEQIRGECVAEGIPFFFKQWGEWSGAVRIGKKAAGREIHGRTWDEIPEPSRTGIF